MTDDGDSTGGAAPVSTRMRPGSSTEELVRVCLRRRAGQPLWARLEASRVSGSEFRLTLGERWDILDALGRLGETDAAWELYRESSGQSSRPTGDVDDLGAECSSPALPGPSRPTRLGYGAGALDALGPRIGWVPWFVRAARREPHSVLLQLGLALYGPQPAHRLLTLVGERLAPAYGRRISPVLLEDALRRGLWTGCLLLEHDPAWVCLGEDAVTPPALCCPRRLREVQHFVCVLPGAG